MKRLGRLADPSAEYCHMIWRHRRVQRSLEHYHGIPEGWRPGQIFALHASLGGTCPISEFEIGPWAAPSWMTNRYEWLRYRETLYRVALGARANDPACVEIAIRYIELRYIGSYSGFIRAKLARSLKSASLTDRQKERLNAHFLRIVSERDYTEEFRDYCALWGRIIDKRCMTAVQAHFEKGASVAKKHKRYSYHLRWLPKLVAAFEQRCGKNVFSDRPR